MIAKTQEDFDALKEIGKIVATIRDEMVKHTKPGITTKELDDIGGELFEKYEAVSGPKGTYDFPGFTCISVNEEVAHGIPGERVINEGDMVNISGCNICALAILNLGISFVVGEGTKQLTDLCEVAKKAFDAGLKKMKPGSKFNGVGKIVNKTAKQNGFTVIENLTGHGVGKSLHEYPDHILSYYDSWDNDLFKEGMVIAFEPFVSTSAEEVIEKGDGWTYITSDNSFVAQIEHTVIITKNEPIIITK